MYSAAPRPSADSLTTSCNSLSESVRLEAKAYSSVSGAGSPSGVSDGGATAAAPATADPPVAGQTALFNNFDDAVECARCGGRMIRTVGKEITPICPLCAFLIEMVSASIIYTGSHFGRPVSLAEIVTCSVIGFGWAANGFRSTSQNQHVRRILVLWPAAPVLSAAAAFALTAIR